MKVSRDQVAENRRNILASAASLFAEQGFETVSLAAIMKKAGLTHGGFYGHFKSKDDLVAQACRHAVEPDEAVPEKTLLDYAAGYLSASHRDDSAGGCPFAALGSEAARQPIETRHELTQGLRRIIEQLGRTASGADDEARRADAIASFSSMLGGLMLARISDDPVLSEEILAANRAALARP